jgi:DNA-binding transcriptional LysR family regulator
MNLVQLQAFEAVARTGTFTAAAEELFVTQPSLSRQIGSLEQDLGSVLFQRGRGGASLTLAGATLLPIARRMLADAEAARVEMDALRGLTRGRVRVGAPPTLCVSVLAEVLAEFRSAFPAVSIEVTEAGSRVLADALAEGGLDLALTVDRGAVGPSVESEPLFREELVVASSLPDVVGPPAAAGAPQARGQASIVGEDPPASRPRIVGQGAPHVPESMTLAELAATPQVAFNRNYDLRQATDAAFSQAGLSPLVAVEGAEMDAVLRFVERGLGVAVVPATILLGRPGLRASRLVEPSLTRTVGVSLRAGTRPDPATERMRGMMFDAVTRLTERGARFASLVTRF